MFIVITYISDQIKDINYLLLPPAGGETSGDQEKEEVLNSREYEEDEVWNNHLTGPVPIQRCKHYILYYHNL